MACGLQWWSNLAFCLEHRHSGHNYVQWLITSALPCYIINAYQNKTQTKVYVGCQFLWKPHIFRLLWFTPSNPWVLRGKDESSWNLNRTWNCSNTRLWPHSFSQPATSELALVTSQRKILTAHKISEKGRNAGRAEELVTVNDQHIWKSHTQQFTTSLGSLSQAQDYQLTGL